MRKKTRRGVLKSSGAAMALAALAGCTGSDGDGGESTPTEDDSSMEMESYSVSIEPVGEVEFDSVPETWVANNGSWADMGAALGIEPPEGVWLPSRYHTQYYDEIPDVSVNKSGMTQLSEGGEVDKEKFYDFDTDVHVMDPNFLLNRFGWTESDIDEIEQIAPLFGNTIFSRGYPWHEDYQYYTLDEAFEKLAEVFDRTDRYEEFAELHEEFQSRVADIVPPESERPDVAIFWGAGDQPEQFYPYTIDEGTSFKQWRDLQVGDALAQSGVRDFHSERGAVEYETLLEVDPEVLLLRGQEAKTEEEFQNTVVSHLEDNNTTSQLSAVQNGEVYQGGPLYQGPIFNLLVTERAVNQIYDVDEELFDRQRVSDIVNGNF